MVRYYLYKSILAVLGFLIAVTAYSQDKRYSIENLGLESDLSESSVRSIVQDDHGYLWVGTLDGLNRYTGYGFDVFRHNPKDTNSISDNTINAVFEDSKGQIWVGTQYGLNKFSWRTNQFKNFYHIDSVHNSLGSNNVFDIYEDHKGNIWVLTSRSLDLYMPEKQEFIHYEYTSSNYSRIGSYYFFNIEQGPEGKLWFGGYNGLYAFEPKEEKFYEYKPANYTGFANGFVKTIFFTERETFLLGTESGLTEFNPVSESFSTYMPGKFGFSEAHNTINHIFKLKSNKYGIGTNGGTLFYEYGDNRFVSQHFNFNGQHLQHLVSSSLVDHSNILWLGTFQNGLLKIAPNRKKFYLVNKTTYPAISSEIIASVYAPSGKDSVWIGTWGNGLNLLNINTGANKPFTQDNVQGLTDPYIHEITIDTKGRTWLGTRNGAGVFDMEARTYTHLQAMDLNYKVSDLLNTRIFNIVEDSRKRLWFTTEQGLFYLQNDSLLKLSFSEKYSIETNLFYSLHESKYYDYIWVGSEHGLIKLNAKDLSVLNTLNAGSCNQCLSNNSALSLHESHDSLLWVGTKAGLNKLSQENDSVKYFIQANTNFSNDNIYNIQEDANRNLWLSTNHGLVKFNPDNETATNYVQSDGLQGYEFNYGATYKAMDGMIYFGGISGLNYFYPDSIQKNRNKPKLTFYKAEKYLKNETITESLVGKKRVVIPNSIFGFNIEFLALEYTHPSKNQYRYKMTGMTEDWRYLGKKNNVSFSRLNPGTYELTIIGSNNDLVWNTNKKTLEIVVKASLFKSVYAYIIYGILGMLLLLWILQLRTQKLRESNQALKERQKASLKIQDQKEELANKNKNITDSINYAHRIIEAMMPTEKAFHKVLPESFLLSMPKDIVSGDFYWIAEKNEKIFVAAVDCTGHGIPGAFMSIIGFDLLRNIIEIEGIDEPAEILNKLDEGVAQTFVGAEDMELSDGMDLSFCVIDTKMNYLEFAGAMNPLYLIRDNNILEFQGDRISVGNKDEGTNKHFSNQRIPLQKDDVIYLFSDGFPDQFGGPKGKKFKYRRFRHLLLTIHKLPFDKQKAMLQKSIYKWMGNLEQVDDILLIGVKPYTDNK